MLHIWQYQDATGVNRKGVMRGYVDRGGTDVTYRFHRLSDDGKPIRYDNGGTLMDLVSGPALKAASRIGSMSVAEYEAPA